VLGASLLCLAIAVVIGFVVRARIRSVDQAHFPARGAVAAVGVMIATELLLHRFAEGFEPASAFFWMIGAALTFVIANSKVSSLHAALLAEEARFERRGEPRVRVATGDARIECSMCTELVRASTTTGTERGIVCRTCLPRAGAIRIEHQEERPRATGGARVRCEVCDDLVDGATTTSYEQFDILCPPCRDELEAGPNRNASFR
jgi:hypothetical protein